MLGLLDFIGWVIDLVIYWRLGLGIALTALACWLLILAIPNQLAQWIICVPLVLIGVVFTFRWQHREGLGE